MAIFLETNDAYMLLQRELPEGVYPVGSPSGSFSAASIYSKAQLVGGAYQNMETIYNNIFPQTANEQQSEWEIKVFGYELSGSLSLTQRQAAVVGKLQHKPGLTISEMIYLVHTITGFGVTVEIGEWQNESGSWLIGVSLLGVTTILGSGDLLKYTAETMPGVDLCDLTAEDLGISPQELEQLQYAAYAYSVNIFGYTLTAAQFQALDTLLTNNEPARSKHFIFSGLNPVDE